MLDFYATKIYKRMFPKNPLANHECLMLKELLCIYFISHFPSYKMSCASNKYSGSEFIINLIESK